MMMMIKFYMLCLKICHNQYSCSRHAC